MNHTLLAVNSYFRSISRAETPSLEAHISKMTSSHVRIGISEPWKMVPVRTKNCLRQAPHFHTRRWDMVRVQVLREEPFSGRDTCDS